MPGKAWACESIHASEHRVDISYHFARGDFELQVVVPTIPLPEKDASSSGGFSFNSCGLLVYVDDKNFLRMERASEGNSGSEFLWIERFADGKSAVQKFHPVANKETALRLQRTGNKLTFTGVEKLYGLERHAGAKKMKIRAQVP